MDHLTARMSVLVENVRAGTMGGALGKAVAVPGVYRRLHLSLQSRRRQCKIVPIPSPRVRGGACLDHSADGAGRGHAGHHRANPPEGDV